MYITPSRGGDIRYTKKINVRATAYMLIIVVLVKALVTLAYGITSTGARAERDPNGYSTIAVDPRVIPLGTKLYVDGYGYAIAEDIGGAIKGNHIDLYFQFQ